MKQLYKNKTADFKETVEFNCFIEKETAKAILIDSEELEEAAWLPKSQVVTAHVKSKPEDKMDLVVMSKWIAEIKEIPFTEVITAPAKVTR